jgi:cholesterol transport system auxiliary component
MRTALVAAVLLIAGCFGGLRNDMPQPHIYRVDSPRLAAGASLPVDLQLAVDETAPGLGGDGIAGRWPGRRLDYIAGAHWADDLPRLLQAALVESFQDSGRLRSVQGGHGRFRATHTLVIAVRRFEADYTGGGMPLAQVELAATVGRNSDRRVLASFTASASEGAAENRQTSVVTALDAAFGRAAAEIAEKAFAALAAEPPAAP